MNINVVNLNDKPLSHFSKGDTLYITKHVNDFSYTYLCEFQKIVKGIVHAKILQVDRSYETYKIGTIISARASACYLWGFRSTEMN